METYALRPATAPSAGHLIELLRRQIEACPDAVAVVDGERELTRGELWEQALCTGRELRRLGAGPDVPVGLYAHPSGDLIAGVWSVLASGSPYLPLSPDYPEERLRYMLRDSGARIVLTVTALAARARELAGPGTQIVVLETAGSGGAQETAVPAELPPPGGPHDLAYIIHTSGSTGRPKGVMIEHASVAAQLTWLAAEGHLGPDVRILQKTPMSFDAAQWELLAPATGAVVVAGAPDLHRDPEALVAAVQRHRVTTLQCVPTLLRVLLETDGFTDCTSLAGLYAGGEILTARLARQLADALPGAQLVNLYGPTECTINATAHRVSPADLAEDAPAVVPIGCPVAGTGAHVLDEAGRPVAPGEKGELYLGGVQLARGYLNLPEQTAQRFVPDPSAPDRRLYRTGDLVVQQTDGSLHFAGRADNQVKLRGYRVELEEVGSAVEQHVWVRQAAAVVAADPRTGWQSLVACVELNPREAALMDQGRHGRHHQSKASRLQVKAQLAGAGLREEHEIAGRPVVPLAGRRETSHQRSTAFDRKTYRFHGGVAPVTRDVLLGLLGEQRPRSAAPRPPAALSFAELGTLLRWFGPFHSEERLLPKYVYASPGALYATQLYLETGGHPAGLDAGAYWFHPAEHTLVRVGDADPGAVHGRLRLHFVGKRRAVEPVYRTNIREVLEMETGHMLGVLDEVLPPLGLAVRPAAGPDPAAAGPLDIGADDFHLGTFDLVPADATAADHLPVDLFIQAHGERVTGLAEGTYRYIDGRLERLSDALVRRRDVIAINQAVHASSSFGVTMVSRAGQEWLSYVALGRALHRLQSNGLSLGLMASGYSSASGHPLPSAIRTDAILTAAELPTGPSYFALGGRISEDQRRSEGMREDSIHMRGPTEMIRDDLVRTLPDYMIPDRVLVVDALPRTANGKIDTRALAASPEIARIVDEATAERVPPRTAMERRLAPLWAEALKLPAQNEVSTAATFFSCGGNSLTAVALIRCINRELGTSLPLQTLFEHPRLADLAALTARLETTPGRCGTPASRMVRLHDNGDGRPLFCWPGLGGYPMNLRHLAQVADAGGPFHGIQATGVNPGEVPWATVGEIAAADIEEIRRIQPEGPYTLWGYSFGARVAFEAAWQLEQAGQKVRELLLICPGNPTVVLPAGTAAGTRQRDADLSNPAYTAVLYSVFAGRAAGDDLAACLREARDEDSFTAFVADRLPELDPEMIRQITRIVARTYEFDYTFEELAERQLDAPITLIKATGDDYSFIEGHSGWSAEPPTVVHLAGDHYEVLRRPGVTELAEAVRQHSTACRVRLAL